MTIDPVVRRPGQRSPRTKRIEIRVTPEAHARITELAKKDDRTFSDMVRVLLARGLERS